MPTETNENDFVSLRTEDGLNISARRFSTRASEACLLVSPGFSQSSHRATMSRMCVNFSHFLDVLCLDYRGTGKSEGRYGFGANEYLDAAAAIEWAQKNYRRVVVLGFSMGAYSALRAIVQKNLAVEKLYLVSCPSNINEVVGGGHVFRHLGKMALGRTGKFQDKNIFFRWGNPFVKTESAVSIAAGLRTPVSFLVGGLDALTPKEMSHAVYAAVPGNQKSWHEFKDGYHAERLFYRDPVQFTQWLGLVKKTKD